MPAAAQESAIRVQGAATVVSCETDHPGIPLRKVWIQQATSAASKTILLTIGVYPDYSTHERNFLISVMEM
jgi:hypothetical protein